MELHSIMSQSFMAGGAAKATGAEYSILVTRRAIDTAQTEGQMLVQMIEQAGGVGQNVNVSA
ncbi:MAG: putative motility protein [Holophagales bacterium]|nr:putative motility protein [Holophagales bacterium]